MLHLLAPGTVGGLERVVCTLARAQVESGMAIRVGAVVEMDQGEVPVVAELRESGVEVDLIAVPPRGYARERQAVRALCRRWRPDVVHSHGYRTDLVGSRVARQLSIPRVSTMHGFTGGDLRNRLYQWLQRREARGMEGVIAVSRALGDRLVETGLSPQRVHVLANAYPLRASFTERTRARHELGLPADAFVVGWVGRLTREKGADVLLDTLPLLPDPNLIASFIGDGSERDRLVADAASRVPGRVHWHGLVLDAARLLHAYDLFVLSSRTEGTPMVLFEAMNARIPIVATRVGGVPDVLRPQDALLVEPDDPPAIASSIRETMRNLPAARARVESAYARLAEYSVVPWLEHHNAIYRRVIRNTVSE